MISKLRFSLIAVLMLVLFGFGLQDQAKGQLGPEADTQLCPGIPFTDGWLSTSITPDESGGKIAPDFSAALIGTVESFDGVRAVAGLDWQHVDFLNFPSEKPTNVIGSQLVTWWSQKAGRNTFVQVTNWDGGTDSTIAPVPVPFVNIHVRILGEDCGELTNFCDTLTASDTHVYNFGDLITNEGVPANDAILQGKEGFVVITAVDDCPSPDQAIDYNFLAGTMQMLDSSDYLYGVNMYHRRAVCFDDPFFFFENLIGNGSFQFGDLGSWSVQQGFADVAMDFFPANSFSPPVPVIICDDPQNPDCFDFASDLFQALVASDEDFPGGGTSYQGGIAPILADTDLIGTGITETNVSVLQSNVFSTISGGSVTYDLQLFNPADPLFSDCDNYTLVCVIDVTDVDPLNWFFNDCDCYNETGFGTSPTGQSCQSIGDDGDQYAFDATSLEFAGGKSAPILDRSLSVSGGNNYVVQVITGQKTNSGIAGSCFNNSNILNRPTNGAVVDNFAQLEQFDDFDFCFGTLDGSFNARLGDVTPDEFAGQFNAPTGSAGADVVYINFHDQYGPPYKPLPSFVNADIGIFDDVEVFASCASDNFCFARLGIDANLVISDDFTPPTLPPTTGPPPTIGPTNPPTTPTPTPTNTGSGGSSSCAIAGNPIQLGTAMANVLIPLIPVAFAFGVRAVRRRKK